MRTSAWIVSQQQYALPRSANLSRNNMEGAIIQLLSLVFGSAAVVLVADLGLDGVDALVMVTVVLVPVVVVVFNVEAAGFTAGSAPGSAAAGSVNRQAHPSHRQARRSRRSPPPASWHPRVQSTHAQPAGVTNYANTSDPLVHATPLSAPIASSHETSTESRQPAAPSPRPAFCRHTP